MSSFGGACAPDLRLAFAIAALLPLALACDGHVTPLPDTSGPQDDGPSPFASPGEDASVSAFRVTAAMASTTICPGQCAELSAQAAGGVPPYAYSWDPAPTATTTTAGNTALACPDASTTYTVTASDSSGMSGEFARPAAEASAPVSVIVSASCDGDALDAGGPASAGGDGGPATVGAEACHVEWAQPDTMSVSDMQMATDGSGNSYVAIDVGPTVYNEPPLPALNLGSPAPAPAYASGFAIAKFDDACHLLWVREFGASGDDRVSSASTVTLRADARNGVTILGYFVGTVDLGAGTSSTATTEIEDGFLMRLDATGKTVFSVPFTNPRVTTMVLYDVAVTPDGTSTIAASTDPSTDFGNGPDLTGILDGLGSSNQLVQFDTAGKVVFRKATSTLGDVTEISQLAATSTSLIWATGWWTGEDASSNLQPLVLGVTSSGSLAWTRPSDNGAYLAAGPQGAVTFSYVSSFNGAVLQAFSADGTSPWTSVVPLADDGGTFFQRRLVVDGDGGPVTAGTMSGTVTSGSAAPLVSAGGQDVEYQAFDSTGRLRSQGRWGGPDDESLGGIGVDSSGDILLSGSTLALGTSYPTKTIFFVKMAR